MFKHVLFWSNSLPVRYLHVMFDMCCSRAIPCLSGICNAFFKHVLFGSLQGLLKHVLPRRNSLPVKACLNMFYFGATRCLSGIRKPCLDMCSLEQFAAVRYLQGMFKQSCSWSKWLPVRQLHGLFYSWTCFAHQCWLCCQVLSRNTVLPESQGLMVSPRAHGEQFPGIRTQCCQRAKG